MAASFAGSRSLDERRRRRLAVGGEDRPLSIRKPSFKSNVSATPQQPFEQSPRFPIHKLISQKLWKHWGVGFVGFAVCLAVLWVGSTIATQSHNFGPGFTELFNFNNGRVIVCMNSVLLLLSGQLAWFIWWVRSKSLEDFAGRYRLWAWAGTAAFVLSFSVAARLPMVAFETLVWRGIFNSPNEFALYCFLPVVSAMAGLFWLMQRDMRNCVSSFSLIWLAAINGILSCVLISPLTFPLGEQQVLSLQVSTGLLGHLCLFFSLLLHTRYVVYESAEPPRESSFRLRFSLPKMRRPRLRRKSVVNAEPITETPVTPPTAAVVAKKALKKQAAPPPAKSKPRETQPAQQRKRSRIDKPVVDKTETRETDIRAHAPIDPNLLKGLSKRERRQLRKQQREKQRAKQTG